MPIYTIVGNLIDRTPKMNGIGVTVDEVYTLNTVDRHGVAAPVRKGGGCRYGRSFSVHCQTADPKRMCPPSGYAR